METLPFVKIHITHNALVTRIVIHHENLQEILYLQKLMLTGLRLLFNNNKFTLTSSAIGNVGTSASASRAIARGRASARNAVKVKFNRK
jgi:hypothetical protein